MPGGKAHEFNVMQTALLERQVVVILTRDFPE